MASRRIEDLTPRMQPKVIRLVARLEESFPGMFRIACTKRSRDEQMALYLRGRHSLSVVNDAYGKAGMAPITAKENERPVTWRIYSIHETGEAVDFFIQRDGKYCSDIKIDTDGDNIPDWQEFGKIVEECGLEWGGTWKTPDLPHVQWTDAA